MVIKKMVVLYFLLITGITCNAQLKDSLIQKKESIKTTILDSITVSANLKVRRTNIYQFSKNEIKPIVSIMGESDVLRYISVLPGISQGMEGGLGYFVRGGNSGNNRIEIDQVPVFGSSHLLGLFSIFHPDIVENVTFNTGKIPSSSGDFTSSLCSIKTITPDSSKIHKSFSISTYMAGFGISAPINKKIAVLVAGRISLLKPEYLLFKKAFSIDIDMSPSVMDLFIKLHYKQSNKSNVSVSGYFSNDMLRFNGGENSVTAINWGNSIFQLNWDYIISPRWSLSSILYSSTYFSGDKYIQDEEESDVRSLVGYTILSKINENGLKSVFTYSKNEINMQCGLNLQNQRLKPISEQVYVGQSAPYRLISNFVTNTISAFINLNYTFKKINLSAGVRSSINLDSVRPYWKNDLRLNAGYQISGKFGIELSFDQLSQYHHVLEGLPSGWPMEIIVPSTGKFKPETSNQIYFGGYFSHKSILLSGGLYYKKMTNLASYKTSLNIFGTSNTSWYDDATSGNGESYGFEFRAERKGVLWNFDASYTLSKTTRQYDDINYGEVFPFKFDRRHILNATGRLTTYKNTVKNKEQNISLTIAVASGHKMTIPVGMYRGILPPWTNLTSSMSYTEMLYTFYRPMMCEINSFSLPMYFRTDIGYSFIKKRANYSRELTFGIINILNKRNPYLVFYDENKWKELSMFPIMPSVRWEIHF